MKKYLALSLALALMCGCVFAGVDVDKKVKDVKRGSNAPLLAVGVSLGFVASTQPTFHTASERLCEKSHH